MNDDVLIATLFRNNLKEEFRNVPLMDIKSTHLEKYFGPCLFVDGKDYWQEKPLVHEHDNDDNEIPWRVISGVLKFDFSLHA